MPFVPTAGVPLRTPVPALNVSPVGSAPVSLRVGAGNPVAVTVNVIVPMPSANVVLLALVIAGAWFTVNVKFCVAFGATPLPALKVGAVGGAPVALMVAAGKLAVVIVVVVVPVPSANDVVLVLVIAGAWFTVSVKFCVAFGATPLLAVIVMV